MNLIAMVDWLVSPMIIFTKTTLAEFAIQTPMIEHKVKEIVAK